MVQRTPPQLLQVPTPNPQGWIKILEKILQISLILLRTCKISTKN